MVHKNEWNLLKKDMLVMKGQNLVDCAQNRN